MDSQRDKAELFLSLHHRSDPLILPNAWDVPSARVFEDQGFTAVATSSAGVMVSLGFQDGEGIGRKEYFKAVARISKAVSIPLSVDAVAGFGKTPTMVAQTARGIIGTGAVGLNIEDSDHRTGSLLPLKQQVERIRAIRRMADSSPITLVINARTDALHFAKGDDRTRFDEAVRRGEAYRDAGADCVYPMWLVGARQISEYIRAVDHPVNVMIRKGLPSVPELKKLGVARISFGPSASYAAMGLLRRASNEVLTTGTYASLLDGAISFDELNSLAVPRHR